MQIIQPEVAALSAVTRAEIDVAIATAKTYPRDPHEFIHRASEWATYDVETAEECIYSVKKGGSTISGPSVRLAEICVQAYQNLRVASRLVEEQERFVVCEAVAHDLESNTAHRAEVVASIWGKTGRYSNDMIQTTVLAAQAKARRNAIFAVIPGAWVKKVVAEVKSVIAKNADAFGERRQKAWDYLVQECGIEPRLILARVDARSLEEITKDDLEVLKSCALDLQEGYANEEVFPEPEVKEDEKPKPKGEAGAVQSILDEEPEPEPAPKKKAAKKRKKKASSKKKASRKVKAQDPEAYVKDMDWDRLEALVEQLEGTLPDEVINEVTTEHPQVLGTEVRIEDLRPYAAALYAKSL